MAQADSRSTASTAGGAARTSTATAQLMERSLSSKLGRLMMRHGSRHLSTFGAPKSFRGFKFQKGPPKLPAISSPLFRKENRPEGRLEKWRPSWGQRTGRDVSQTRLQLGGSKRAIKKDGAPLPSFEWVRRLA